MRAVILGTLLFPFAAADAQERPPLTGTVNPRAVAPPLEQPPPIGGLRTRPLSSTPPRGATVRLPRGRYYSPRVADAPRPVAGIVVTPAPAGARTPTPRWFATIDPPRWRIDSSKTPVQAWRDLIVNDVICDGAGSCLERERAVRAPWVAVCRCYLLVDALGRRYRLDD